MIILSQWQTLSRKLFFAPGGMPLSVFVSNIRPIADGGPRRRRLPDERQAITHKFDIAGTKGYLTIGLYEDGSLGEIFIKIAKEGSVMSGMFDSFAISTSIALQYGVPLSAFIDKFKDARFEPSGITRNPDIVIAKSIMDYIFRWMELKFQPSGGQND